MTKAKLFKIASPFLILAMVLSMVLVFVPTQVSASPDVIHVPADYATIQAAINAANPGDTIIVHAGRYTPDGEAVRWIIIDKPLTLQGENKETTIIDGEGKIGELVLINANNVTFTGFTVTNAKDYGIFINELTTPITGIKVEDNIVHDISWEYGAAIAGQRFSGEITDNEIYNGGSSGINFAALDGDVNVDITNNSIHDNSEGIFFYGESGYFVNASITGNGIRSNQYGTVLYSQIGNVGIHYNNICSNSEYGVFNNIEKIVDATYNWWGANDGPSGGVADPMTGTLANGSGDKVSTNVHFDPWLIRGICYYDLIRDTQVCIRCDNNTFHFTAPGYDSGWVYAPRMRCCPNGRAIILYRGEDAPEADRIGFICFANSDRGTCRGMLIDQTTHTRYIINVR
jgi:hypothetical protein